MTLRIESDLDELYDVPLPVTIRRPDMALVRRARTREELTLDPGEYWLSAELPSGATLSAVATVGEKGDTTAYLRLDDDADIRPLDIDSLSEAVRPARTQHEKSAGAEPVVSVGIRRGNVFGSDFQAAAAGADESPRAVDRVAIWSADRRAIIEVDAGWLQVAQVRQVGLPPLNLWLPTSGRKGCTLKFAAAADGSVLIRAVPDGRATALAMAYGSRGMMWEAASAVSTPETGERAELMLRGKGADPIGAVVGAYTLLRIGSLDRMRDWCDNLFEWFPEMPDAAVILGELAARRGEHAKALETLLTIPSRGIPLFTEGLALAGNRLRHYHGVKARAISRHREEIEILLMRLADFERSVDFRSGLTRYWGSDPAKPMAAPHMKSMDAVPPEEAATAYARWTLEAER